MNKYLKAIEIVKEKTDELVECIENTLIDRLKTKAQHHWIGGFDICFNIETEEFEAIAFMDFENDDNLITLLVIDDDLATITYDLEYFRDALFAEGIEFDESLTNRELEEFFADDYNEFVECLISDLLINLDVEMNIVPIILQDLEASLYCSTRH